MTHDEANTVAASRRAVSLSAAVALALSIAAVPLALFRSHRTGIEVGLLALSQWLFVARTLGGPRLSSLRIAGWACIVAVFAIAVEPHVH